jgi:hypothetical protein
MTLQQAPHASPLRLLPWLWLALSNARSAASTVELPGHDLMNDERKFSITCSRDIFADLMAQVT